MFSIMQLIRLSVPSSLSLPTKTKFFQTPSLNIVNAAYLLRALCTLNRPAMLFYDLEVAYLMVHNDRVSQGEVLFFLAQWDC